MGLGGFRDFRIGILLDCGYMGCGLGDLGDQGTIKVLNCVWSCL